MRKTLCVIFMCLFAWRNGYSQTISRISISSINSSISTGQDYTPWLNDDTTKLVTDVWGSANMQYVDVKLKLQTKATITKLSLYDYSGIFTSTPASIYSVNGSVKTLIGTFTGPNYMAWDDINLSTPLLTDTIIIHKYGNCIPEKIKIYGTPSLSLLSTPITGYTQACVGGTTSLGNSSWGGTWTCGNTAVATIGASTGVVTGKSAGTAVISYNYSGLGATTTVTINPAAKAGSITGTTGICPLGTTALAASGESGGSWSSSSPSVATVSATGVVTGVSIGTCIISYTVTGSCGSAAATKVVTVGSSASAGTITGSSSVCPAGTTALSNTVTGGVWSSGNPAVATVSTTGTVKGVSAGNATISYKVKTACGTATATKLITVTSTPSAGTIAGAASVCPSSTTSFTDATSGGTWSSSAPGIATVNSSGVVTGIAKGTATISYNVTSSCGHAVATKSISVQGSAPSAGSISGATSVTAGTTTTLTNTVPGGSWSSTAPGKATVSTTGIVTGVSAGSSVISYTVANSCGTTAATAIITVSAPPVPPIITGTTGSLVHGKIPMDAKRWYQLNNTSNGLDGLFDGVTSVAVQTGWGKILTNYDAYYPVLKGEQINIDSVRFYSGTGSNTANPFTLYYIDSLWNRVKIATFVGGVYNSWVGPDPANPSNYSLTIPANNVKYLVINCSSAYPNEMELYGSYIAPNAVPAATAKTIKLKQEFGINAFEWDFENPSSPLVVDPARLAAAKSFTGIRHYLDWEKLEPTKGGYTFNPSHSGGWNLDTMYATCKANGIEVLADIKTQPGWMQATYTSGADAENVPVPSGSDFTNPASYLLQAKMGFQFAARYGSNSAVSSSLLSVDASTRWTGDPANVVRKGLDYVKYIECDNERDKWWKGRNAYQTGREYAANLSAFYDGNKNTMGAGVGVKNADPAMQVVMGGVACPTTDYLKGMIDWCKEFRGYKSDGSVNLCWDVINYHIYPDNGGSMQGAGTRGAAPEVAHMDTFAAAFVNVAHAYAQDMPVWITETGYDINQSSVLKAIPIGSKTALQTQADWILRNSLLYARMGIDRTFFYMVDDDDVNSSTKFASSGLINSNYTRKPAADYLLQANKLLGEYVYKETICNNPIIDRYELGGNSAYMLVKPSENGSTIPYTLHLSAAGNVRIYNPVIGQDSMSVTTVASSGSTVALTVTETPMFVIPAPGTTASRLANNAEPGAPAAIIGQSDITVFPNPTTGNVSLSIDNEKQGEVNVMVYTEGGRVCKTYQFNKAAGKATQAIDLSLLPGGLYLMEVGQGNEKVVKKVIKVNQ